MQSNDRDLKNDFQDDILNDLYKGKTIINDEEKNTQVEEFTKD